MTESAIQIHPLSIKGTSLTEQDALNRDADRIRPERLPVVPPVPVEETIQNLQSFSPFN